MGSRSGRVPEPPRRGGYSPPVPDPENGAETAASRRDRSVARVIDPARQRAEQRVQRFLDAALELLTASGGEFTLQEVVERSGLSLRSFYQHFGGKHELLLALFEDSVRQTEGELRAHVDAVADPLERLHVLLVQYYLSASGPRRDGRQSPALSQFAQSLLVDHPREVSAAFAPVQVLFEEVLKAAGEAGAVRVGPRPRRRAAFLFRTVNFNAYVASSVGASRDADDDLAAAEDLWDLLLNGLRAA